MKFIAIQSYLMKQEKSQINNLTLPLKQLEKEQQTKAKISRGKEIIKKKKTKNIIEQNINRPKIHPLPRLIKQINFWQN